MSERLKCALAVGGGAAAIGGGSAAILLAIWAGLEEPQRGAFAAAVHARLDLALLAHAMVSWFAGLGIVALFRRYVSAPRRLAEETRLIARVNPAHRLQPPDAPELALLAGEINGLAVRVSELGHSVAERVASARADLEEEKSRLAALMEELAQGVLVCNVEGGILLHNRRARDLLKGRDGGATGVGLGRSLFGVIDRTLVLHALAQVAARLDRGEAYPVAAFTTALAGGRTVRALLSPVPAATAQPAALRTDTAVAGGTHIAGYVITFESPDDPHAGIAAAEGAAPANGGRGLPDPLLRFVASPSRPAFYDFDLFGHTGRDAALEERPLRELIYSVFDTETTGLDPAGGDEIISIGAVRIVNGRLLHGEFFDQLIDPGRSLPAQSVRIHGITPAMLAGQPAIGAVLPRFHAFCADTVLVAHNAAFDLRFLQLKEKTTGVRFEQPILDTLLLSAVAQPRQQNHALEAIAARLGVNIVGRHTALGDAIVTGEIFLKLLPLLAAAGVNTLREAQEACRRTAYAKVRY